MLLVVTVGLLGGCSYGLGPAGSTLPKAFTNYLREEGMTFSAAMPGAGVMTAEEVVAAVQSTSGADRLSGLEAVPVFGVLQCIDDAGCGPGPGALPGVTGRAVWVLFYPDLEDLELVRTGGWVIIDALTGLESGFEIRTQ